MSKNEYYIKNSFDYEIKDDYNKLLNYLNKSKYYQKLIGKKKGNRVDSLNILGEIGDTTISVKHTPDRKTINLFKDKKDINSKFKKKCILCLLSQTNTKIYPINLNRSILWKNYIITANTYPYFKNHMLVLSTDHNHGIDKNRGNQNILHKNKYTLKDMIDLYMLLGQKGTMFFNGLIGNSQTHFHFHITSETIPIQKLLYDKNEVNYEVYETKRKNKILIFKNNNKECVNGLIFYGYYKSLSNDIFNFIKYINSKKLLYNILFIENKENDINNNITCIVYIRKKFKNDKEENYNMGSTTIGGILVTIDKNKYKLNTRKFINSIKKYCKATLVKPTKDLIKNII